METRKLVSISLPPPLLKAADQLAASENRSRSELMREALRQYVQQAETRREKARQGFFRIVERIHRRTRKVPEAEMRALIAEAIREVRAKAARGRA